MKAFGHDFQHLDDSHLSDLFALERIRRRTPERFSGEVVRVAKKYGANYVVALANDPFDWPPHYVNESFAIYTVADAPGPE